MKATKLTRIFQVLTIFAVFAMLFVQAGTHVVLAQGEDPNTPHWQDPDWVQSFVESKVNAVFSPVRPLPTYDNLPQGIKDALNDGMSIVLVEPWRKGCPEPLTDSNCNVGYVKSFESYIDLYNTVYGSGEANVGHFGPWQNGSIHLTRIPEVAAGVADVDWDAFARGELRLNFAENQLLPNEDPTNGLYPFRLVEPWRHGCVGLKTDEEHCNVGLSGKFATWKELKDYLSIGQWTRGSVMVLVDATPTPTVTPTMTATPTETAIPGPTETPDATETALWAPETETPTPTPDGAATGGGNWLFWLCLVGILLLLGAAFAIWYFLIRPSQINPPARPVATPPADSSPKTYVFDEEEDNPLGGLGMKKV